MSRRVSSTMVTAPTGGVSQQPAYLRYPGQCEFQQNAWCTPVDGLRKRQPTEHISTASNLWCVTFRANTVNGTIQIKFGSTAYSFTADAAPADTPPFVFQFLHAGTVDLAAGTADNFVNKVNASGIPKLFAYTDHNLLAGVGVLTWIWSSGPIAISVSVVGGDSATALGAGLASHGSYVVDHWIWRDADERYLLVLGDREARAVNLNSGDQVPVIPKGGSGAPTDFSYAKALRSSIYINDESGAGLSSGGAPGKGGTATSKFIAPLTTVGPYGGSNYNTTKHCYYGIFPAAQIGALCDAGAFFFSWLSPLYLGSANPVPLSLGWNGVSCFFRQNDYDPSPDFGLAIYDDTNTFFVARAKWTFGAGPTKNLVSTTPTIAAGGNAVSARAIDLGCGWYFAYLAFNLSAPIQQGHAWSAGAYLDQELIPTLKKAVFCGLRFFQGTSTDLGMFPSPNESLRALTVNDYTIVTNNKKLPAFGTRISPTPKLITLGQHGVGWVAPADGTQIDVVRSDGATRHFIFHVAAGIPADTPGTTENYYVDTTTNDPVTLAAPKARKTTQRLAEKMNKAFGSCAYAVPEGPSDNTCSVFLVDPTYGYSSVIDSVDAGNKIAITDAKEALFWVKSTTYDCAFWNRFKQTTTTTYDVKVAAVTNLDASGVSKGEDKCVNGSDNSSPTLCFASNSAKGLLIKGAFTAPKVGRTKDIATDDIAEDLRSRVASAITVVADEKNPVNNIGYGIIGPTASGISLNQDAETMVDKSGSVYRLTSKISFDEVDVIDGLGNTALIKAVGEVARSSDLPTSAQHGTRLKVTGDTESGIDDTWVQAVTEAGVGFGKVRDWIPSTAYGVTLDFDKTTMPEQITRQQDDASGTKTGNKNSVYLQLDYISWVERQVGDDTLNTPPSFIGKGIEDVKFSHGRFFFIASDRIIGSEVNVYFNYWRTSTTRLLDSDPIDNRSEAQTAASDQRPSFLKWMLPFGSKILTFSEFAVFAADGQPTLTPKTIEIVCVESLDTSTICQPIAYKRSAFFAQKRGDFTSVYELAQSGEGFSQNSINLSANVPRYISGNPIRMAVSSTETVLAVLSDGARNTLSIYQWEDVGDQRSQSAWFQYTFEGTGTIAAGIGFIDSDLYLLIVRPEGWTVERMAMRQISNDPGKTWMCHLDRRISDLTPGFSMHPVAGPATQVVLPYFTNPSEIYSAVIRSSSDPFFPESTPVGLVSGNGTTTLTFAGDLTPYSIWLGTGYPMRYKPTIPMLREPGRGALIGMITGRLEIRDVYVAYHDTTYFEIRVTPRGQAEVIKGFLASSAEDSVTADEIVQASSLVPPRARGRRRVPVLSIADQATIVIASDSHQDLAISKLEFIATHNDEEATRIPL